MAATEHHAKRECLKGDDSSFGTSNKYRVALFPKAYLSLEQDCPLFDDSPSQQKASDASLERYQAEMGVTNMCIRRGRVETSTSGYEAIQSSQGGRGGEGVSMHLCDEKKGLDNRALMEIDNDGF